MQNRVKKCGANVQHNDASLAKRKSYAITESALEYSVGGEFKRTVRNKSIGAGWRYTFGFMGWLGYTIMPGRFFGGDNYNPYSNTINLYSDLPPVGLHESGHSKDFAQRTYKGTYGFMYSFVPLFNLYPEAKASSEALSYLRAKGDRKDFQDAYKLLYPAYGTYLGGSFANVVAAPWIYAVEAGFIIPAHVVGRVKAAHVPEALPPQPPPRAPDSHSQDGIADRTTP